MNWADWRPRLEGLGGPWQQTQLLKHFVFTSIYLISYQTDNLFNPQFAGIKPLYSVCIAS